MSSNMEIVDYVRIFILIITTANLFMILRIVLILNYFFKITKKTTDGKQ